MSCTVKSKFSRIVIKKRPTTTRVKSTFFPSLNLDIPDTIDTANQQQTQVSSTQDAQAPPSDQV